MLIPISQKYHYKRLKEKNIVIESIFYNEDKDENDLYVRSTDNLRNDSVIRKYMKEKRYFLNNDCIHVERKFPKNVEYTLVSGNLNEDNITCPNCGHSGPAKNFFDGCSFCGTSFNMDYKHSTLTLNDYLKIFNYKSTKGIAVIIAIIACIYSLLTTPINWYLIITMILGFPLIVFLTMFALSLLIGPFFIIALIISILTYTDNSKETKIKSKICADLNTNLLYYYYNEKKAPQYKDLIDFDIVKFKRVSIIQKNRIISAKISFMIRKVLMKDKKIKTKLEYKTAILEKCDVQITNKTGIINCKNCGASINLLSDTCEYCGTPNEHRTEWSVTNIEEL